jgi:fatty acid desaturase
LVDVRIEHGDGETPGRTKIAVLALTIWVAVAAGTISVVAGYSSWFLGPCVLAAGAAYLATSVYAAVKDQKRGR